MCMYYSYMYYVDVNTDSYSYDSWSGPLRAEGRLQSQAQEKEKERKEEGWPREVSLLFNATSLSSLPSLSPSHSPSLFLSLFLSLRLLDWRERRTDGPKRMKNERILVFKHLFDPKEFDVRGLMHDTISYSVIVIMHD